MTMRRDIRAAVTALVLMGAVALPAAASEGPAAATVQPAVLSSAMDRDMLMPTAFKSGFRHMSLEEVVAILAGAAAVGTAADWVFGGGTVTILGVVAGAALGSEWYERRIWPF
jgi:hypothetical protein